MNWIFVVAALIVAAGGLLYRRRLRELRDDSALDDASIREIEERGRTELDEPLDWEQIEEEQSRFWEESWDEPEEW